MPEQPPNEVQDWVALFIIAVVLLYWLLRVTVLMIGARVARRREQDIDEGPDGDKDGMPGAGGGKEPPDLEPAGETALAAADARAAGRRDLPAWDSSEARTRDVARLIEATRYALALARQRGNLPRQIDMLIHLADLFVLAGDRAQAAGALVEAEALLRSADVKWTEADLARRQAEVARIRGMLEGL